MTFFALSAAATLAILAFHLVRPNFRDLRISIARLLPTPPPSAARHYRFPSLPKLRSVPFWARMLACAAILALLWPQPPTANITPATGLGLRIVLDISPSMQVHQSAALDAPNRITLARDAALAAIAQARNIGAESGGFCLDIQLVGADITPASLDILAQDPMTLLDHQGAGPQNLTRAILRPSPATCAISHAIVITDLPDTLGDVPADSPVVLWHQIGAPRANLAIHALAVAPSGLGDLQRSLDIVLRSYGTLDAPPVLTVETPTGLAVPALRPDLNQPNLWHARLENIEAGRYHALLDAGGAFRGDDQAIFTVHDDGFLGFDWQFDMAPPPGLPLAAPGQGILVTSLAQLDRFDPGRPFVALYDAGPFDPSRQTRIGPFLDAHPILQALDFDAFERAALRPAPRVPAGLIAALQNDAGQAFLALRNAPRSVVVAAPLGAAAGAAPQTQTAYTISNIMFFAALDWVAQGYQPAALAPQWRDVSGQNMTDPHLESDTARALAQPPDYTQLALNKNSDQNQTSHQPIYFDWTLLFVLALLLVERVFGQFWRSGPY